MALTRAIVYQGAGTVEFIVDSSGAFYFLEMNTRLQVEHAVTEMVTGTDLVRWQIDVTAGKSIPARPPSSRGHAIECRLYAEDPDQGFAPCAGQLHYVQLPSGAGIRVDAAVESGSAVPVEYDPMIAKIVAWAPDRAQATRRLIAALQETVLLGVTTNQAFLIDVLSSPEFAAGDIKTDTVEQRETPWADPDTACFAAAAVAAALVERSGGFTKALKGENGGVWQPGPWQTLGPWRLQRGRDGAG